MQIVKALLFGAVAIAGLGLAKSADASVVINISEVGTDIALTASGTFDQTLAVLRSSPTSSGFSEAVIPDIGFVAFGFQSQVTLYELTGPANFGSGSILTNVSSNFGLGLGLNATAGAFFISSNYLNNAPLSSSGIITNSTLASVGATPGVYNFLVGGNAVTVNINGVAGAVPEPATWAMMLMGFGAMGVSLRRRRRRDNLLQAA